MEHHYSLFIFLIFNYKQNIYNNRCIQLTDGSYCIIITNNITLHILIKEIITLANAQDDKITYLQNRNHKFITFANAQDDICFLLLSTRINNVHTYLCRLKFLESKTLKSIISLQTILSVL